MLTRYLGNKAALLDPILEEIGRCAASGTVADLFAGTLSVSLALKARGYGVIANDVQPFSAAVGEAFLVADRIPAVPDDLVPRRAQAARLAALAGSPGFGFLGRPELVGPYARVLDALDHLEEVQPAPGDPSHFFDTYTEAGARSAFVSGRGRAGRRRFFAPENGRRIDAALNELRRWWRAARIDRPLYKLLCCALVRAVEKVSNTQGTYHDFPREFFDPRAARPLRFEPPPMDVVLAGGRHRVGQAEDSLAFASEVGPVDVLYLDPPYNFRQYTAYYFLPNLLCRYGDLADPDDWFAGVRFVRGQNPADDFTSTFCAKARFLDDLGALVDRVDTEWVVLSYFDGRNHFNEFGRASNGVGRGLLTEFFSGPRFAGVPRVRPVERTNYQSYGGHRARPVDELLYVARKAT